MTRYCAECNKYVDTKLARRKISLKVKGIDISVDADVFVCDECEEQVWDRETDDTVMRAIYDKYRTIKGLLLPEEIKDIRSQYGVSQVAFAKILGLGEKTIARYENGSLQDEGQNNLILLVKNPENFMILLGKNKEKLNDIEIRRVFSAYMLYTLQKPVKYCVDCKTTKYKYGSGNRGYVSDFPKKEGAIA